MKKAGLSLLGVVLGATSMLGASSQVIFSGSGTNTSELMPSYIEREKALERIRNATGHIKSSDDGPEIPASMPATGEGVTVFRNKQLQEWLDQQQNWIFVNEPSANKYLTTEGMQEKYEADFSGNNGKSKKVIDKYIENLMKEQNTAKKGLKNSSRESDDIYNSPANEAQSRPGSRERSKTSKGFSDKDPSLLGSNTDPIHMSGMQNLDLGSIPEMKESISSAYHSGMTSREERLRQEHLQSDRDYYQLLHPEKASSAGPNDPINQMVDTSRNSVQPVTAPTMDELDAVGKSRGSGVFGQIPAGSRNRQTSYDDLLSTRVFGSSSLSPSLMNSAPAMVQPKPAVLEMPKRKF